MADADKKAAKPHAKPAHRMLPRKSFDIMPAGHATPTTRPIIASSKPGHADTTLKSKPGSSLMSHHPSKSIEPIGPVAVPPAAPAAPQVPAAPVAASAPAPAPSVPTQAPVTPPQPNIASAEHVPAPAFPDFNDTKAPPAATSTPAPADATATADKPAAAVPDVASPPTHPDSPSGLVQRPGAAPGAVDTHPGGSHDTVPDAADELDLSTLTGLHGIGASTPAAADTSTGKPAAPAAENSQAVQQTPGQAVKLAAALRDLKHHPAPPLNTQPTVVVHQHDYLRSFATFVMFAVIGLVVVAIAVDLLIDSGVLQAPIEVPTNFFK